MEAELVPGRQLNDVDMMRWNTKPYGNQPDCSLIDQSSTPFSSQRATICSLRTTGTSIRGCGEPSPEHRPPTSAFQGRRRLAVL